jgi:hypothetical protein
MLLHTEKLRQLEKDDLLHNVDKNKSLCNIFIALILFKN